MREVNTVAWLSGLRTAVGRDIGLGEVPSTEWDRLAAGVDAVWLMGVWERSDAGRAVALADEANRASFSAALPDWTEADVVGSAYSIGSYSVATWLGGGAGLRAARRELAERGAGLVVDFVPNHVGLDHPWLTTHPEAFIRGDQADLQRSPEDFFAVGDQVVAHGRDPFFPPWRDVAQLNFFSPAYRELAIATLTQIAASADAVRCDMAMLGLNDVVANTWGHRAGEPGAQPFWVEVVAAVRATHPNLGFLAEAYWDREDDLLAQGFDACYDKTLYDRLLVADPAGVRAHLAGRPGPRVVRFVENHDEPRAAAAFSRLDHQQAATVAVATLPGVTLWFEGQFAGHRVRLPVFLRRDREEAADAERATFHAALAAAMTELRPADGVFALADTHGWPDNQSHTRLLAWTWTAPTSRVVVVVNLAADPSAGLVSLPWQDLADRRWALRDPLAGATLVRDGDELARDGLFVDLGPFGVHTFVLDQPPVAGLTAGDGD